MDLSICIVSYNCRDLLARCLRSLQEHAEGLRLEVIVTDNASTDGTPELVTDRFPEVRLLASEENLGFAGGTNLAMYEATADTMLMLNPDTEVQPGALRRLAEFLRDTPDAGCVGPALYGADGKLQYTCHAFPSVWLTLVAQLGLHRLLPWTRLFGAYDMTWWDHARPRRVDWLSGAAIATRREVWEDVGPLDERFFMYSEDVDWCYRLAQAGWDRWYLPDARIVHFEAGSWGDAPRERILAAHAANFRFFGKHYSHAAEVAARALVAIGSLARGNFWTIAGPVVGDRSAFVTNAQTHFSVTELATDFNGTWRLTRPDLT